MWQPDLTLRRSNNLCGNQRPGLLVVERPRVSCATAGRRAGAAGTRVAASGGPDPAAGLRPPARRPEAGPARLGRRFGYRCPTRGAPAAGSAAAGVMPVPGAARHPLHNCLNSFGFISLSLRSDFNPQSAARPGRARPGPGPAQSPTPDSEGRWPAAAAAGCRAGTEGFE